MQIIKVKDSVVGGKKGFEIFKQALANGAKVFGLATGSTPETTYTELRNSDLDFSQCVSLNLDEYVGLQPDNPQSYYRFMHEHLFDAKPFKHNYLPNGMAPDIVAEHLPGNPVLLDLQP